MFLQIFLCNLLSSRKPKKVAGIDVSWYSKSIFSIKTDLISSSQLWVNNLLILRYLSYKIACRIRCSGVLCYWKYKKCDSSPFRTVLKNFSLQVKQLYFPHQMPKSSLKSTESDFIRSKPVSYIASQHRKTIFFKETPEFFFDNQNQFIQLFS